MTRIGDEADAQRVREQQRQEEKRERQRQSDRDFSELVEQRRQGEERVREQRGATSRHAGQAAGKRAVLDQRAAQAKRQAERLLEKAKGSLAETSGQARARGKDQDRTGDRATRQANNEREGRGEGDPLGPIAGEGGREGGAGGQADGESSMAGGQQQRGDQRGEASGLAAGNDARAGQAETAVLRAEVIRKLVDRIMIAVDDAGKAEVLIELGADVLGGATLRIRADGRAISATFVCDDANTRRLIRASEGPLARVLARRGMSLKQLTVEEPRAAP